MIIRTCWRCKKPTTRYSAFVKEEEVFCEDCFIKLMELTIKTMIQAEEMLTDKTKLH